MTVLISSCFSSKQGGRLLTVHLASVGRRRSAGRTPRIAPRAQLVDPTAAGKRLVAVPPKLDPSKLADIRKAEAFGPRGLLLIGMSQADCQTVSSWFQQMEAGFVVSCCPAALLAEGTLQQAVGSGSSLQEWPWETQPADAPPVAFFSGMSGEEQVALIESWAEHTGLQAPAFASVTPGTLDKQLRKLLADIVRAQGQQPPPGFDPEQLAEIQAATSSSSGQQAASSSAAQQGSIGAAATGLGGEQALRDKLQDYVMINTEGQAETAPMSLSELKEQIQDKIRRKRAAAAEAERQARKAASQDETDRMRAALRGSKKQQKKAGGTSKGFGSK